MKSPQMEGIHHYEPNQILDTAKFTYREWFKSILLKWGRVVDVDSIVAAYKIDCILKQHECHKMSIFKSSDIRRSNR